MPEKVENRENCVSVICPCCSVALSVERSFLINPSEHFSGNGDYGWFFLCGKCNNRWWFSSNSLKDIEVKEEKRKENIEDLKRLFVEFSNDGPKSPQLKSLDNSFSEIKSEKFDKKNDEGKLAIEKDLVESIKEELLQNIKNEIDNYAKQKVNEIKKHDKKIHFFGKTDKVGSDFFPSKNISSEEKKHSYKRILPSEFQSVSKVKNENKKNILPSFFYNKQKTKELKKITNDIQNFDDKDIARNDKELNIKTDNIKTDIDENNFSMQHNNFASNILKKPIEDFVINKNINIPSKLKTVILSSNSKKNSKNPYIAIQEENQPPKIVDFPSIDDFDKKLDIEELNSPHEFSLDSINKKKKSFTMAWLLMFFCTIMSVFLTKKYENVAVNLWKGATYGVNRTKLELSVENVRYSILDNGKIVIIGEIINRNDASAKILPVNISVICNNQSNNFNWKYFPENNTILPNEKIHFRSEYNSSLNSEEIKDVIVFFE